MILRSSVRAPWAVRGPVAGLLAFLALAVGGAATGSGLVDLPGSYIAGFPSDDGIPTGLITPRGVDLATPNRDRGPGDGGRRHADVRIATGSAPAGTVRQDTAPEGDASRALARAGRLSAPGTAPPQVP